jgi:predicted lipid carrier protein YhbT
MTTVEDLMQRASKMIDEDPDQARKFGGIYKFALGGDGGRTFMIDLTDDPRVIDGDGAAQCTISMAACDFIAVIEGRTGPRTLFFKGRLSVSGDWRLAMRMRKLNKIMGGGHD